MSVVIVIVPVSELSFGGYGIALRESLGVYENIFSEVVVIGPNRDPHVKSGSKRRNVFLEFPACPMALRFLLSLLSPVPAVAWRYWIMGVFYRKRVQLLLDFYEGRNIRVIYEDLVTAALHRWIVDLVPWSAVSIRSHNVLVDCFNNLERPWYHALMWKLENWRIRRFESYVYRTSGAVWAITEEDAQRINDLYSVKAGIVGVSAKSLYDAQFRYVPSRDNIIGYFGAIDLRKGGGLMWFLREVWWRVRRDIPNASFRMAGRGTEDYNDPERGIFGWGIVKGQAEFLSGVSVMINPQQSGGGIKLKTLSALANGIPLVSTSNGVSGLVRQHESGVNIQDSAEGFARAIVEVLLSKDMQGRMSAVGIEYVRSFYETAQVTGFR